MEDRFDSFGLESPFVAEDRFATEAEPFDRRPWPVREGPGEEALAWPETGEAEGFALEEPETLGEELCESEAGEGEGESFAEQDAALAPELAFEEEWKDLGPAEIADEAIAQPPFSARVRARIEPLLDAAKVGAAATWNGKRHPTLSGVPAAALLARLERYVDRAGVEQAMRQNGALAALASDQNAVLAVLAHQFQHKIYAAPVTKGTDPRDGKIGEGTLDALGFVRHRDRSLNATDQGNVAFHVVNKTKAYQRVADAYRKHRSEFAALGSDLTPANWYYLFVSPPFLGRPINWGVSIELMRRLRLGERWLSSQPRYADLSPAEIGGLLGLDEDHAGGRHKNNTSMHTLGLAVDIGYIKNPWVAGQHDSPTRNAKFMAATENASLLLTGKRAKVTPAFLAALGNAAGQTTGSAYDQVRQRHDQLLEYLGLQSQPAQLRLVLQQRQSDGGTIARDVLGPGGSIDRALVAWRNTITADRARLREAFQGSSSRDPADGFLNLPRDLVVALRDHGCLAWGGIDLGSAESGDMMHFDCRPQGLGLALAQTAGLDTTGANHPCRATPPVPRAGEASFAESWGPDEERAGPAKATPLLGGQLWTFAHAPSRAKVTLFVPPAALGQAQVELLFYIHGLFSPCGYPPQGARSLVGSDMFRLGRYVAESRRPMCLIVPQFQDGGDGSWETKGLDKPAALNRLLADCLADIGQAVGGTAPTSTKLTIAGHSKAYELLNRLAQANASPDLQKGALAGLSEIWLLDTTYSFPTKEFEALLAAKPGLKVNVVYLSSSKTDLFGGKRATGRLALAPLRPLNHCTLPAYALPALLAGNEVPASINEAEAFAGEGFASEAGEPLGSGEALSWLDAGEPESESFSYLDEADLEFDEASEGERTLASEWSADEEPGAFEDVHGEAFDWNEAEAGATAFEGLDDEGELLIDGEAPVWREAGAYFLAAGTGRDVVGIRRDDGQILMAVNAAGSGVVRLPDAAVGTLHIGQGRTVSRCRKAVLTPKVGAGADAMTAQLRGNVLYVLDDGAELLRKVGGEIVGVPNVELPADLITRFFHGTRLDIRGEPPRLRMTFRLRDETEDLARWVRAKASDADIAARRRTLETAAGSVPAALRQQVTDMLDLLAVVSVVEGGFGSTSGAGDTHASLGIFQWAMARNQWQQTGSLGRFFWDLKTRAQAGGAAQLFVDAWAACTGRGLDIVLQGGARILTLNGTHATGAQVEAAMSATMATGNLAAYQLVASLDWINDFRNTVISPGALGARWVGHKWTPTGAQSGRLVLGARTLDIAAAGVAPLSRVFTTTASLATAIMLGVNRPAYVPLALWRALLPSQDPSTHVGALLDRIFKGCEAAGQRPANRRFTDAHVTKAGGVALTAFRELQDYLWPANPVAPLGNEQDLRVLFERKALLLYDPADARRYARAGRFATVRVPLP
jgi:hypothetical protein